MATNEIAESIADIKLNRRGAVGALLDIYEKAILDLKKTIEDISDEALVTITDTQTTDENCKSLQSILSHVLHSGYGYAASINNTKGHAIQRPGKNFHVTIKEYVNDLFQLFAFTENVFKEINDNELEEFDNSLKIKTKWGPWYDIEQMMEHAIVHILRHKRQIDKMKRNALK